MTDSFKRSETPMADSFLVRLSTSPVFTWWVKHVASPLDPLLFRATNGRLTCFGPPAMPMLTLTVKGRRSGKPRSVHLACLEHEGDHLVVASAMGQQRHLAWRYNLEANPEVEVQARGERFPARARPLTDADRERIEEARLEMARGGLRTLALARRELPHDGELEPDAVETELTLLGPPSGPLIFASDL